jgi:hypothetical protein
LVLGSAQEKALGLIGPSSSLDGWVGIASDAALQQIGGSWSYSATATPGSNQYYLVGVLEHEITEVMGRTSYLDVPNEYGVMDLYRYKGAGLRQTGTGSPAYFSTNGGATNLDSWNTQSTGDIGDWAGSAGADAFLAFNPSGQINTMTPTDLTLMSAIGWTVNQQPPSNAWTDFFNEDWKADILWRSDAGEVGLWNSNSGSGVSFTSQDFGMIPVDWHIQDTADFNGDGKADILWRSDTGEVGIWNSNAGSGVSFTSQDFGTIPGSWHIVSGH